MNAAMLNAIKKHWPEYLIEAWGLGFFMVSACVFGVLLEHPDSPARQAISEPFARRVLGGIAMGGTMLIIVYSPWGKQSGAHLNPALTLTFFRLGKIAGVDTIFYILAQFVGGIAGVLLAAAFLPAIAHPSVNYVVTAPGTSGVAVAFGAEFIITFILMLTVLMVSNQVQWARYTGLCAGSLVALYISVEAPLSGMSMNPARTLGSAVWAHVWTALWLYFTAPLLAMLLAAEAYLRLAGAHKIFCAKLHHQNDKRCIFRCNFPSINEDVATVPGAVATGSITGK
jgi:aquaporin Z